MVSMVKAKGSSEIQNNLIPIGRKVGLRNELTELTAPYAYPSVTATLKKERETL